MEPTYLTLEVQFEPDFETEWWRKCVDIEDRNPKGGWPISYLFVSVIWVRKKLKQSSADHDQKNGDFIRDSTFPGSRISVLLFCSAPPHCSNPTQAFIQSRLGRFNSFSLTQCTWGMKSLRAVQPFVPVTDRWKVLNDHAKVFRSRKLRTEVQHLEVEHLDRK